MRSRHAVALQALHNVCEPLSPYKITALAAKKLFPNAASIKPRERSIRHSVRKSSFMNLIPSAMYEAPGRVWLMDKQITEAGLPSHAYLCPTLGCDLAEADPLQASVERILDITIAQSC